MSKNLNSSLFEGDAKPLMDFMKSTSDIALIKLTESVSHVNPIPLYLNSDEEGKILLHSEEALQVTARVVQYMKRREKKYLELCQIQLMLLKGIGSQLN